MVSNTRTPKPSTRGRPHLEHGPVSQDLIASRQMVLTPCRLTHAAPGWWGGGGRCEHHTCSSGRVRHPTNMLASHTPRSWLEWRPLPDARRPSPKQQAAGRHGPPAAGGTRVVGARPVLLGLQVGWVLAQAVGVVRGRADVAAHELAAVPAHLWSRARVGCVCQGAGAVCVCERAVPRRRTALTQRR
jgi:hypothetical protein